MKMPQADNSWFLRRSYVCGVLLVLSAAVVLLRIASEAWIGEDALITFRTIDNFVSGYGLRWNIDERVQVYTHPLWMLVNAAAYAITREIPYTVTTISLVLSVGAYFVVARRLMGRPVVLLMSFFILFLASKSLVLYGTSGFETPLSFLLLAVFTRELLPEDSSHPIRWGWLALYTALAAVNRLDHILLCAPALIYLCIAEWRRVKWGRLALGMTPLAVWLLFSLLYYGFLLPNTARAKLCAEIPVGHYVREGILYTANLIRWDPVSAPILVMALATAGSALVRLFSKRGNPRAGRLAALGAGVFLYGGYILWIGGGFLSGRFWAPPLFAAILVIVFGSEDLIKQLQATRTKVAATVIVGVMVLLLAVYALALGLKSYPGRGPIHDRSVAHFYLKPNLTWAMTRDAARGWFDGLKVRRHAHEAPGRYVRISGAIGFRGFAAGREVTFIDYNALADPLLAQLPLKDSGTWRIGHLRRTIPAGYFHARQTDSLDQMDPPLREYYRHLRLIVSGPIFDRERLRTIANLHLGRYDHLLEQWKNERTEQPAEGDDTFLPTGPRVAITLFNRLGDPL